MPNRLQADAVYVTSPAGAKLLNAARSPKSALDSLAAMEAREERRKIRGTLLAQRKRRSLQLAAPVQPAKGAGKHITTLPSYIAASASRRFQQLT
jgi:hypothetical protein